jgi:endo-1,4-beta-xylanase
MVPRLAQQLRFRRQPATEAERLLTTHIRTVTDRYRGVITSYDVVNETIDHDTHGLMRDQPDARDGQREAVLDLAFHTARDQLPTRSWSTTTT